MGNTNGLNIQTKLECSVCGVAIWEYDGVKYAKTDQYNEIFVKLNDKSKMKVGVCSRHQKPTKKDLGKITKKNLEGWLEEVAIGVGNSEWVMNTGSKLKVVGLA